jgi:hypothetical protein
MRALRVLALATSAALAAVVRSQSLGEQATVAGINGTLAGKAAPAAAASGKKARATAGQAARRNDPFTPASGSGLPLPAGAQSPASFPFQPQQAPPPPPPAPWLWRLKGFVAGRGPSVAVLEGPTGTVFVKAGDKIDDRSKVVRVSGKTLTVKFDDKTLSLSPW